MSRTLKDENDKKISWSRRQRGLDREAHFAANGTVEGWIGRHSVEVDKHREHRRLACRGNHHNEESD